MWILKDQFIINTDNISVIKKDDSGNLVFRDGSNVETRLSNVPEDIIHQIWMAHKKGQDLFVIAENDRNTETPNL